MIDFKKYFIFLKTKWIFDKPKKKEFLIYDGELKDILLQYIPKKKTEVFHIRKENINLFILFKTICRNGLNDLFSNYQKNFFNYVKPRYVLTLVDLNVNFFKLKEKFPHIKFICVQKTPRGKDRELKSFQNQKNLACDYFFSYSDEQTQIFKKFIKFKKVFKIGSFLNNHYSFKTKKIKKILFIMISSSEHIFDIDLRCLNILIDYAKKKKIKFDILLKPYMKTNDPSLKALNIIKSKFRKDLKYLNFIGGETRQKNYSLASKYKYIVFNRSTMGYECFVKNSRIIALTFKLSHGENYDWDYLKSKFFFVTSFAEDKKFPSEGFCWTKKLNKMKIFSLIDKVRDMSEKEWTTKASNAFRDRFTYDPHNRKFTNFINKIKI